MIERISNFFESCMNKLSSGGKNLYCSFQNKDTVKKLIFVVCSLLLLTGIVGLIGFLILFVYRFINNHMGEMVVLAISIGTVFSWFQSRKEQREAKQRKAMEEQAKALIPKANSVYEKIGNLMIDILRDRSIASLINLARPTNFSNIIMENPEQRIQIKPDGSGYLLMYRADKMSICFLEPNELRTIRDVLQGSINQKISAYGIAGLCPPKQNTFLYIMGEPYDSHSYITLCLDYNETTLQDTYSLAPVFSSNDNIYG